MECKQGCTCVICDTKNFRNNIPERYFEKPEMFKPKKEWKKVGIWRHGSEYETFYMDPDCNNPEGIPVVIKKIWQHWIDMGSNMRRDILSQLKKIMDLPYSPYHLPLLKILCLNEKYYLVFPKTKNRISLMERIRLGKYFSYEDRLKIAKQVLKGLIHYEKNGFVNKDISSMNVELDDFNNVKLINPFVCIPDLRTMNSRRPTHSKRVNMIQDNIIYLPNECVSIEPKYDNYAPFAYSTILFELATRTEPYADIKKLQNSTPKIFNHINKTGGEVTFPDHCKFTIFNDIITLCRDKDARLRPGLEMIDDMINQLEIPADLLELNPIDDYRTIEEATEMFTREFDDFTTNQAFFFYQVSPCVPGGNLRNLVIKDRMNKKNDGKQLMELILKYF